MDREQRSRKQSYRVASTQLHGKQENAQPPINANRDRAKRMDGQKKQAPKATPKRHSTVRQTAAKTSQRRPTSQKEKTKPQDRRNPVQQNPQKAGYPQGTPRVRRRVTHAEQVRIRRRRAFLGALCVLAALAVGVILSFNLLFKVAAYRVENMDRSTPANTGIYSEQEILNLLGVQVGDNLFSFSTAEKSAQLAQALPYLEQVQVKVQIPSTVVIKVEPAVERFTMEANGSWLVLSSQRKVLRMTGERPDGLIWLDGEPQTAMNSTVGQSVALNTYNSLDGSFATGETARMTADQTLETLLQTLETYGLLDGTTYISLRDLSELNFMYDGRISVVLGTAHNLEYKIRLAASAILDVDGEGLTASDHGTLNVSYQRSDGDLWAYFQPAIEPTPEPVQTAEPTEPVVPEVPADPIVDTGTVDG